MELKLPILKKCKCGTKPFLSIERWTDNGETFFHFDVDCPNCHMGFGSSSLINCIRGWNNNKGSVTTFAYNEKTGTLDIIFEDRMSEE